MFCPLADLPDPGIGPLSLASPALQADSLPAEPQGKPKNTAVGSISLLQRIFPTQESNQGLMHCRCILCQLSYAGSSLFSECLVIEGEFCNLTKQRNGRGGQCREYWSLLSLD